MSDQGMLAAVAAAAGQSETEVQKITVDAAFVAKHFPETAKALREEGATAENERITGIEKAAVPGHEAIIAAHKADRSKTPGDAALAVIAAQNAARAAQLKALDTDEGKLKGLRSESANGAETRPASPGATQIEGEAKWKAEWASGAPQKEGFASEADYLAFKRADSRGAIKVMSKKAA